MRTGSRVALFIGTFVVLTGCIFMLEHGYRVNIHPDREVKKSYQQSNSFLISKRLGVHHSFNQQYRADFLISYNVDGVQYNRWVSGNGLDMSFEPNRAHQENLLSQFSIGGTYPIWYNPRNPQMAVLLLRSNWLSTLLLIAPAVLSVVAFYVILHELLLLMAAASAKIRKI